MRPRILGLTGGTGAGKSLAAERFRQAGIPVLDADRIGHEVIAPGGAAYEEVRKSFPEAVAEDGSIDRRELGKRVFSDPSARLILNHIVHPAIRTVVYQEAENLYQQGFTVILVDAALLAEDGQLQDYLDGLILVMAPEELRIERLIKHCGLSREMALARVASQISPKEKLKLADYVINNAGTLEDLHGQVDAVAEDLRNYGQRTGKMP